MRQKNKPNKMALKNETPKMTQIKVYKAIKSYESKDDRRERTR